MSFQTHGLKEPNIHVVSGNVEKIDSLEEEVPISLSPGSPVPSPTDDSKNEKVREFIPSIPL